MCVVVVVHRNKKRRHISVPPLTIGVEQLPSGLTRQMEGVISAKLVSRMQADDDKRVAYVVFTSNGLALLKRATPIHLGSVRRMMIDHLTSGEIKAIGSAFTKIANCLETEVG